MMKNLDKYNDFKYIPCVFSKGESTFEGIPCPTKRAYESLGDDGVATIHQKLQIILGYRKEMFGDKIEHHGLHPIQHFKDLQSNIVYRVGHTLQDQLNKRLASIRSLEFRNPELFQEKVIEFTPELVVPEIYTENHYEMLKNIDHYLIRSLGKDSSGFFDSAVF